MKKTISIILTIALIFAVCSPLSGCTRVNATNLMQGICAGDAAAAEDLRPDSAAITDFGVRLFQETMEDSRNTLISPLSVLCALAMTANGADGGTLAQMEGVLGLPIDTLNRWLRTYMEQLPSADAYQLRLANAIWFRDDPALTVQESFLQANADYYGAGAYKIPFDDAALKTINRWVEENTNGMIPEILDRIPEDAVMYLVNALAFEAEWETVYEAHQIRDGIFTTEDGTFRDVQMMHSQEGQYLEDEHATGFIKYYKDRKYAFVALLPKEGVSVTDYVSGLTGEQVSDMLSSPQAITVYASMPKFETGYGVEMSEVLKDMGMTDAFDWTVADFSRLGSYSGDVNICIRRVIHKTFLSVSEQGTRAGAATAVEMVAEGASEAVDHRTVILDRPFVYMLVDCQTYLPCFIGTMMDVNGG